MTALLILLALLLLALGAAGTVYPALPSLPLMFGGAWLLAYAQDYQVIGEVSLWLVFAVAAVGLATDYVAGLLGAKYTGAGKSALWGAFVGSIVGAFMMPAGLLLGPLLGAALGEFADKRSLFLAGKVGLGALAGFVAGTAAKIGAAVAILLVLLVRYLAYWFG